VLQRPLQHLQVPAQSSAFTRERIPRAAVLPRPHQRLQVPIPSGECTRNSSHGQSCSRAHCSASTRSCLAASAHVSEFHGHLFALAQASSSLDAKNARSLNGSSSVSPVRTSPANATASPHFQHARASMASSVGSSHFFSTSSRKTSGQAMRRQRRGRSQTRRRRSFVRSCVHLYSCARGDTERRQYDSEGGGGERGHLMLQGWHPPPFQLSTLFIGPSERILGAGANLGEATISTSESSWPPGQCLLYTAARGLSARRAGHDDGDRAHAARRAYGAARALGQHVGAWCTGARSTRPPPPESNNGG
jgi:hypothetical protein